MFRSIRRKKNEISIDEIKKILIEARRGILALNADEGYPYAIPLNFYYDDINNKIYFHSGKTGYKVDCLYNCDKVCFTVLGSEEIKEETWAPFVTSVVIFGRCHLIDESLVVERKLKQFAMKYYPNEELVDKEISNSSNAVKMYEIDIEHITGKQVQEK